MTPGAAVLAFALATDALAADELRRYALFVGANDGGDGRTALRYAHDDAEALHDVLSELGGVTPGDGRILLDPDPSALDDAFAALGERLAGAGTRAEVVFYYSGHSDEQGLLLGDALYPYRDLKARLDALPAKVRIAILDSCASGAMIRAKGGTRVAPFLVDESQQVGGVAYITSSSEDEVAQEADRIGGSYFTHALTTGLRGAADASGDRRVTLYEAYHYAFDETLARTERSQHGPQHAKYHFELSGSGDLVLTDLLRTDATLVLDAPLAGRALVRDADGRLVAELRKVEGATVDLGLPEGQYSVTLTRADGRYGLGAVSLANGESTLLAATALQWRSGEVAVARGGPAPTAALVRAEILPGLPGPTPDSDLVVVGALVAGSEHLRGFSTAPLGVRAERLAGWQFGWGYNHAGGGSGLQLSTAYNGATSSLHGMQIAFGVNHIGGEGRGAQIASMNHASDLSGVQIGLLNVGGTVRGAQLGLVNVARNVDGVQIGLLNVAHDVRGTPIGLLSLERQGRHDLLVYAEDLDVVNLELKLGGEWLHTVLGGGGTPGSHAELHVGLGGHIGMGPLWLDLDAMTATYGDVGDLGRLPTIVGIGRASLGLEIVQVVQPFVGAALNVPVLWDPVAPVQIGPEDQGPWPTVLGGIALRPLPNER